MIKLKEIYIYGGVKGDPNFSFGERINSNPDGRYLKLKKNLVIYYKKELIYNDDMLDWEETEKFMKQYLIDKRDKKLNELLK